MCGFDREEYALKSNEELVKLAQSGDEYAYSVLSGRFLNTKGLGGSAGYLDSDDFVQEGMLGFMKAVKKYDFSRGVPFEAFAFICMQNSINSAADIPQNEFPSGLGNDYTDSVPHTAETPLDAVISDEKLSDVLNICETSLSDVEKAVVYMKASGESYDSIGKRLGISPKSVDNALQRARKKLNMLCTD